MRRIFRLLVLIFIAIVSGVIAICLGNYYFSISADLAAKGTVSASVITVFGVIFSALYKEISSYYQERSQSICRKWDLIFPFIKSHYNPWIGASNSWLNSLEKLDDGLNDVAVTRVLYLTTLFFGIRMRFLDDGGVLLLSSSKEEKKVSDTYDEIKKNYKWFGNETSLRDSYLQKYFIKNAKPGAPLVFDTFYADVQKTQDLKECKDQLQKWLADKKNIDNLKEKVKTFSTTFKASIDKLYTAWSD